MDAVHLLADGLVVARLANARFGTVVEAMRQQVVPVQAVGERRALPRAAIVADPGAEAAASSVG